jgi:ligand-binding SRPBCC domain-containing protein
MKIVIRTKVEAQFDKVVKGFDKQLFEALKPPLMSLDVKRFDGCLTGDEVHLSMGIGPFRQQWISVITYHKSTGNSFEFIDEGSLLPPPLRNWKHRHIIANESDHTLIIDDINYSSGLHVLDILMYPFLYFLFAARIPVYKRYFAL